MTAKSKKSDEDLTGLVNCADFFVGLINTMPIHVFVKDRESRFFAVNQTVADLVGVPSPEDVIGKTDFDFFPEHLARQYREDEEQMMQSGNPIIHKEEDRLDRNGVKRWIWTTKMPLRTRDGKIVGIFGFSNDVTERKEAEEFLKNERNLLRTLIDSLPDYIYYKDADGRFLVANKKLAKHMGASSPEDLIGTTDFDFYPEPVARVFRDDELNVMNTGKPIIEKGETNLSEDGKFISVLTTKVPLKDEQGKILGIAGTGHDITEQKKLEEELRQTNARLTATIEELKRTQDHVVQNERLRALGQMASGIAHDFNNALTPIICYGDMLVNDPKFLDDRKGALAMINTMLIAGNDAAEAIRRLREFYNPQKPAEVTEVNLKELVDTTVSLTKPLWKEQMAANGINIAVEVEVDPSGYICANESQMREILTNLVFNSVDAMPKGGVISIRAYHENSGAVIEVGDNGYGMSEEVRRRCFEPFFTTKKRRGSGLGLSVVHGILRRYEGEIDILSKEGMGTTVIIKIPDRSTVKTVKVSAPSSPAKVKPLRVLLVDDEAVVRNTVTTCLISDGHSVKAVPDGAAALDVFRAGEFDLVITDRAMPGMSGDAVAAALRTTAPAIKILMLTGFGDIMMDEKKCPPGVDLVLPKPITAKCLRDAILRVTSSMPQKGY